MREELIIAGAGGQGIMFMGRLIAQAALKDKLEVTRLPSYGAEVRGGTSHCMVIISDKEIASPFVNKADTIIVLNEPSLNKFKDRIKNNGLMIINASLIEDKNKLNLNRALFLPFSDIASKLGDVKVANMVALGVYIFKKNTVSLKSIVAALRKIFSLNKKELLLLNEKAIKEGMDLVGKKE